MTRLLVAVAVAVAWLVGGSASAQVARDAAKVKAACESYQAALYMNKQGQPVLDLLERERACKAKAAALHQAVEREALRAVREEAARKKRESESAAVTMLTEYPDLIAKQSKQLAADIAQERKDTALAQAQMLRGWAETQRGAVQGSLAVVDEELAKLTAPPTTPTPPPPPTPTPGTEPATDDVATGSPAPAAVDPEREARINELKARREKLDGVRSRLASLEKEAVDEQARIKAWTRVDKAVADGTDPAKGLAGNLDALSKRAQKEATKAFGVLTDGDKQRWKQQDHVAQSTLKSYGRMQEEYGESPQVHNLMVNMRAHRRALKARQDKLDRIGKRLDVWKKTHDVVDQSKALAGAVVNYGDSVSALKTAVEKRDTVDALKALGSGVGATTDMAKALAELDKMRLARKKKLVWQAVAGMKPADRVPVVSDLMEDTKRNAGLGRQLDRLARAQGFYNTIVKHYAEYDSTRADAYMDNNTSAFTGGLAATGELVEQLASMKGVPPGLSDVLKYTGKQLQVVRDVQKRMGRYEEQTAQGGINATREMGKRMMERAGISMDDGMQLEAFDPALKAAAGIHVVQHPTSKQLYYVDPDGDLEPIEKDEYERRKKAAVVLGRLTRGAATRKDYLELFHEGEVDLPVAQARVPDHLKGDIDPRQPTVEELTNPDHVAAIEEEAQRDALGRSIAEATLLDGPPGSPRSVKELVKDLWEATTTGKVTPRDKDLDKLARDFPLFYELSDQAGEPLTPERYAAFVQNRDAAAARLRKLAVERGRVDSETAMEMMILEATGRGLHTRSALARKRYELAWDEYNELAGADGKFTPERFRRFLEDPDAVKAELAASKPSPGEPDEQSDSSKDDKGDAPRTSGDSERQAKVVGVADEATGDTSNVTSDAVTDRGTEDTPELRDKRNKAMLNGDKETARELHEEITGDGGEQAGDAVDQTADEIVTTHVYTGLRDSTWPVFGVFGIEPTDPVYLRYREALGRGDGNAAQAAFDLLMAGRTPTAHLVVPPTELGVPADDQLVADADAEGFKGLPRRDAPDPSAPADDPGLGNRDPGPDGDPGWAFASGQTREQQLQQVSGRLQGAANNAFSNYQNLQRQVASQTTANAARHWDEVRKGFGSAPSQCPPGYDACGCPEKHMYMWCYKPIQSGGKSGCDVVLGGGNAYRFR